MQLRGLKRLRHIHYVDYKSFSLNAQTTLSIFMSWTFWSIKKVISGNADDFRNQNKNIHDWWWHFAAFLLISNFLELAHCHLLFSIGCTMQDYYLLWWNDSSYAAGGPGSGKISHSQRLSQESQGRFVHVNVMELLKQSFGLSGK